MRQQRPHASTFSFQSKIVLCLCYSQNYPVGMHILHPKEWVVSASCIFQHVGESAETSKTIPGSLCPVWEHFLSAQSHMTRYFFIVSSNIYSFLSSYFFLSCPWQGPCWQVHPNRIPKLLVLGQCWIFKPFVWKCAWTLSFSGRKIPHRPRKHKKENYCHAPIKAPASDPVKTFSPVSCSGVVRSLENYF